MDWSWIDQLTDRMPENQWLRGLAVLVAFTLIAKIVDWVVTHIIGRWARKTKTDLDDRLVDMLHRPIFYSVLLLGVWLVLLRVDLHSELLVFLQRCTKTIAMLIWSLFAWRASRIVLDVYSMIEERMQWVEPRTVPLFDNTMRILLAAGMAYSIFVIWGVNLGAWLAGAGIVGIAVGFAAKDTLANLFAGIFILVDAPYELGDFVVLDQGDRGRVTKIGLRSTRILTRDDIEITIPNAVIGNASITNQSGGPWEKQRIRIDVGVAYGSDIDQVKAVLMDVAVHLPEVSKEPDPRVRFRRFGDSALEIQLMCWVDEPVLSGRVTDALNTAIYKRFQAEGIEIPFPMRQVLLQRTDSDDDSSTRDL
jgi:small-conductance mechanosensitive channel